MIVSLAIVNVAMLPFYSFVDRLKVVCSDWFEFQTNIPTMEFQHCFKRYVLKTIYIFYV
jgi:hypothetical protein